MKRKAGPLGPAFLILLIDNPLDYYLELIEKRNQTNIFKKNIRSCPNSPGQFFCHLSNQAGFLYFFSASLLYVFIVFTHITFINTTLTFFPENAQGLNEQGFLQFMKSPLSGSISSSELDSLHCSPRAESLSLLPPLVHSSSIPMRRQ
jgi:hypothetical protein